MSIAPVHINVAFLSVLVVVALALLAFRLIEAALAVLLQQILLFIGILAACAAVVLIVAAARSAIGGDGPASRPAALIQSESTAAVWVTAAQVLPRSTPARALSVPDSEPVPLPTAADIATEREQGDSSWLRSSTDSSVTGEIMAVLLIGFLVMAVAISQLLSAVLPILIIVLLVPAPDRAELADLIAAMGGSRKFGVRSAVWAAMSARKRRPKTRAGAVGEGRDEPASDEHRH